MPASPALIAAWNQADARYTAGDPTGARDVLEQAAEVAVAVYGPDNADVIETQRRLALVHRELDDPAAARRTLEQALAAGLLRYGEADPLMLSIFAELGAVAEQLGNRHEARRNFMRVIQYGPEVLGFDHPDVRAAQAYLGGESAGPVYIPPPRPEPQGQPAYQAEPASSGDVPAPSWGEPAPSWPDPAPSWADSPAFWGDTVATEDAVPPAPVVEVEQIPAPSPPEPPAPPAPVERVPPLPAEYVGPALVEHGQPVQPEPAPLWPAEHVQPEPPVPEPPVPAASFPAAPVVPVLPVEAPVSRAPAQLHAVPPPNWQGDPPQAPERHPEWTATEHRPGVDQPPAPVPDGPGVWRFEPNAQPAHPQAQPTTAPHREPPRRTGERHRVAIPLLVLAGVALLALAAASVFTVLVFLAPPASDNASGGAPSATPSMPTLAAPSGVKLRDNGASITLTWRDPSHATLPFIVAGGHAGDQSRPYLQVPAGQTTVTLNGLSTTMDYCFTVVAVYTTDQLAPSELVCTKRDTRSAASTTG